FQIQNFCSDRDTYNLCWNFYIQCLCLEGSKNKIKQFAYVVLMRLHPMAILIPSLSMTMAVYSVTKARWNESLMRGYYPRILFQFTSFSSDPSRKCRRQRRSRRILKKKRCSRIQAAAAT
ncbi:MAG: hypothetical protein ACI90V_014190, partial [Bacillariaceae sp.]